MAARGTFVWDVLLATAHSSLGLEGWMVGRFGCWNQEDQKDKGGEMQDTMIYIYISLDIACDVWDVAR